MQGWFWRGMLFALLLGRKPSGHTSKKLGKRQVKIRIIVVVLWWQRERSPSSGELQNVKVGRIQKSSCLCFKKKKIFFLFNLAVYLYPRHPCKCTL